MKDFLGHPSCKIKLIAARAELLNKTREFFATRRIIEVDTPLLCQYPATAVHIDPISVPDHNDPASNNLRFLQTSPEYAMKRLLAAGSSDLFQICKAFRANEIGKLHNPEFTILEWYRINFDHHKLMTEVAELLNYVLGDSQIHYQTNKISYREVFLKYLNIDPFAIALDELRKLVKCNIELSNTFENFLVNANRQACQELLFNSHIEPHLNGKNLIWMIYDYPEEQAALSKLAIDPYGDLVGQRFEVYIDGIELANGYYELIDPEIQYQRFILDQELRAKLKKNYLAIDPYLIAALNAGLPSCSGVALGVDRLLMLKTKAKKIQDVICFPWDLA